MPEFRMPSLGADMERGRVIEWYVNPGSVVRKGDIAALVETEKAAIEIEVFTDGVVEELLADEGESVTVGSPIALIASAEAAGTLAPPGPDRSATPREAAAAPRAARPTPAITPAAPGTTSPLVRRLARERGVELSSLQGTAPGTRICRADVEAASAAPGLPAETRADTAAASPATAGRATPRARRLAARGHVNLDTLTGTGPRGTITGDDVARASTAAKPQKPQAPSGADASESRSAQARQAAMRTAIGRLMARSKREVPHYYVGHHIDLDPALEWLEHRNKGRSVRERLLPAVLLLKATALAARELPDLNGYWIDDAYQQSDHVHLGVAISLRQGGLIAPAILDADRLGLDQLMTALRDLVTRTRGGRLRASEMSAATITVTNLGEQGVETVYGVIYAPQVALVGFGRILLRPWPADGVLGVRRVVSATVSADHRASDGHRGALLLAAIDRHLQEPETL